MHLYGNSSFQTFWIVLDRVCPDEDTLPRTLPIFFRTFNRLVVLLAVTQTHRPHLTSAEHGSQEERQLVHVHAEALLLAAPCRQTHRGSSRQITGPLSAGQ